MRRACCADHAACRQRAEQNRRGEPLELTSGKSSPHRAQGAAGTSSVGRMGGESLRRCWGRNTAPLTGRRLGVRFGARRIPRREGSRVFTFSRSYVDHACVCRECTASMRPGASMWVERGPLDPAGLRSPSMRILCEMCGDRLRRSVPGPLTPAGQTIPEYEDTPSTATVRELYARMIARAGGK